MSDKSNHSLSDLVQQAIRQYEQALQTGFKLEEESAKCWTECFAQATALPDWQRRWKDAATETLPLL